jgi:hypothetical protein
VTELSAAVRAAVDAVRAHFAGSPVEVTPDGAGGVTLIIENIDVGSRYLPRTTWLGFQINAAYPAADVYPHYVGPLTRTDGQPHGSGIQTVTWNGRPGLQLSRRSTRWNPALDNATVKAEKVIIWLAGL